LRWLTFTLVATGWFGYFVGTQRMLHFINSPALAKFVPADELLSDQRVRVLIEGTGEALTCVSASLMFVVVIGLLGAVGHRRFPLPNPGAVPR
jgi:hypothetical protein